MDTHLIGARELEIVKHWQIDGAHNEAHGDDSAHDVEIVDAVDVDLRRCAQQRNSRYEAAMTIINR